MKDDILELLDPELLGRYRRFRPYLVALQFTAMMLAIAALSVALIDDGKLCVAGDVAYGLLIASLGVYLLQITWEKRLTRSISTIGILFSTRLRIAMSALWLIAILWSLGTVDALYNSWPDQKAGTTTCH